MSVTLNGSNGITFNDGSSQTAAASPFGLKNRIINGDMRIDQRNAGASVTPATGTYTLDRWFFAISQSSKFTSQQDAGAVTPPVGFVDYLGITSSSAYSLLSADYFQLQQRIEGYNIADLGWGTANAKTITLSFWARSSLTGTFGGSIRNSADTYGYCFSYTISSANTWEYKTITVTGPTSGTWLTTNGLGIDLRFSFGMGTSYSGSAGTWGVSSGYAPTGAVNVLGTNGATFYLTGVQLEVGSTATPFERRQYGNELALCQRYYQKYSDYDSLGIGRDTGTAFFGYPLRPKMRTNPTCTYTCGNVDRFGIAFTATTAAVVLDARDNHVTTYTSVTMSGRGEPCGPANSVLTASAEL